MLNAVTVTFIIIYALKAFFIMIGNTFAIFVFWKHNFHQNRSCLLLINLAVADLLVGIADPIVLLTGKVSKVTAVRTEENNTINPASALQILASRATVFFLCFSKTVFLVISAVYRLYLGCQLSLCMPHKSYGPNVFPSPCCGSRMFYYWQIP